PKDGRYELKEGLFRIEVPSGWSRSRDEASDKREGVYGIILMGPAAGEGPRPSIAIEYYPPGNGLFPSAEEFLARQGAKPEKASVAGLPARRWNKEAAVPYPPNSLLSRPVPMKTQYVLIDSPRGFHAVVFSCPEDALAALQPAFDRLLSSLEVL